MATLMNIPEELFLKILKNLGRPDIFSICFVSKKFARGAQDVIYRSPYISARQRGYPVEMLATTLMERPELAKLVRSVKLELTEGRRKIDYDAVYRNRIMSYAAEVVPKPPLSMKKWKSRLRDGDEITWAAVLLACTTNLRDLDLSIQNIFPLERTRLFSQREIGNYKGAFDIMKTDSLRKLRVDGFHLQWECFKRLQLEEFVWENDVQLPDLLQGMPKISISTLEYVLKGDWHWHSSGTPIGYQGCTTFATFVKNCPRLKTLRLRYLDKWVAENRVTDYSSFSQVAERLLPLAPTVEVLEFVPPKQTPNWANWEDSIDHVRPFDPSPGRCLHQFRSLKKLEVPQRCLFDHEDLRNLPHILPPNLEVLTIHAVSPLIIYPLLSLYLDTNALKKLRQVRLRLSDQWQWMESKMRENISRKLGRGHKISTVIVEE
ncbi:hypothetical protein K491DRAFT_721420 [Lophiostoma macrostomum CBS 122681]|uniref:F-box domain-containing protein n=1 Tax=Lophiostoma macrostomum CBS 122681 TaxID=1314788 RepID=A0A6A6SPG3_9PLEO|nr:hypothetical protein K491DRAFT_721420 [Lophiostoma macrostomum CBS 122681]